MTLRGIYLAGPDVFFPNAIDVLAAKKALCARYGCLGLPPLDVELSAAGKPTAGSIFARNLALMRRADLIIANLTPFRGPGADAGTVYELGYMAGRRKLCLGYSNDPSLYAERVARFTELNTSDGRLTDAQGLTVENFDLPDNLMMIHALDLHGCPLAAPRQPAEDIWHDLTSFETCVRLAAERLAPVASR